MEALGVAVYTTDAQGRITLFNEPAVQLWGRRPVIGKDLWCGSWKLYWPNGTPMKHEECPMAIALKEGRIVRDVEILVERPDGSRAFVLPYPTPLRDQSGELIGGVNVLIDITERKKGEEAALTLAAIIRSSDDAIVSKDLDGTIISWNPGAERMFGYTAEEAVGRSIRMIIPEDRLSEEDAVLAQVRNGERVDHFETVRRRKDGTLIPISLTVSPVKDASGGIIGASKVARDISERKAAEEALRRAMEVKDEFLSLVSHELRTPITTVVGNGHLLLRRARSLSEEDANQALTDMVAEAERLQRIIENLLMLTRMDPAQDVESELLLLPQVIQEAIQSYERRNKQRQVRLCVEGTGPIALGEQSAVQQILLNLISNADKYSPPSRPIEIIARSNEAGEAEVRVRDYGIGLDAEDVPNLFTSFYRGSSAKHRASGLGLGLVVCKRLVEAQNGRIWAENRPESGCDFVFTLPAPILLEDSEE